MTDKLKAKIERDAVEWIQKNLIRECDGMFREPCAEVSYTAGAASLLPIIEQMRVALQLCLVRDTGNDNHDYQTCKSPSCGIGRDALSAYERFVEEK